MSMIDVKEVSFYYEGSYDMIFDHVSFRMDSDWKLGFIGRNGRGKTTFLKLLLGSYEYVGTIQSDKTFEYFPYPLSEETREKNTIDVIEEMDPGYELWMVTREMMLLQVDMDVLYRPFHTLSFGEQTKTMLAVLFAKENQFLLIDEPTNHLDREARNILKEYLKKKHGFILVSHDRELLDACIDHVLVLNKEQITVERGNFSSWWENKRRQDEFEKAENDRLKKDIKRLRESARKASQWADKVESTKIGGDPKKIEKNIDTRAYLAEQSRRMQQRRKNLVNRQEKAIESKSKLLKNIEETPDLKLTFPVHHKKVLVEANDFSVYYGEKQVFSNLRFQIKAGDQVALRGENGSGKSTLIKAILGEELQSSGSLSVVGGLKISYINQDTRDLKGSLHDYVYEQGIDKTQFMTILRKLDFEREQFEKNMESFSDGQRKKVLIAKSLCEQAHLYIWDEPLNYIDVFSRMQLEELLLEYKPTLLVVEHDETFLRKVTTSEIRLSETSTYAPLKEK